MPFTADSARKKRQIEFRRKYHEYLLTPEWKALADEVKKRALFRCQVCNSPDGIHVHHRTYTRVFHERIEDLVCLCSECHERFHDIKRKPD